MIKILRSGFIAFSLSLLFIACNDSPTAVGSDLIPDEDKISFKYFDSYSENLPQSSNYYEKKLALGTSNRLLLGKTPIAESSILLQFNPTLVDSLNTRFKNGELVVSKSWITMNPTYYLGEKSENYDFTVHQIRSAWGLDKFDRDSLAALKNDAQDIRIRDENLFRGDTALVFNMNNDVVTEWLKRNNDTSLPNNYGLLLKPTGSTNRIIGFNAVDVYSTANSIYLQFEVKRGTAFIDTVNVLPYMDNHSVNLTGNFPSANNQIFVQGGYAIRGQLYFNLAKVPKRIVVNKAILELTVNYNYTIDSEPKSDSFFVKILADSVTRKMSSDSVYTAIISKKTGDTYSGDITWMVQKWIEGTPNHGITLELADEEDSAARIVFYGSKESNTLLKPRLKLTYTIK